MTVGYAVNDTNICGQTQGLREGDLQALALSLVVVDCFDGSRDRQVKAIEGVRKLANHAS